MIKQRIELILVSVYKSVCNARSVKGDLSWTAAAGSRQREEKLQQLAACIQSYRMPWIVVGDFNR